jgi:pyridoxine kinase
MIQGWQAERPDGVYILDPVLGDGGRLYVDSAIVDQIRQKLLPVAHIVTPNQFELGLLTDSHIETAHEAARAAKTMLQQNPNLQAVIATGIANEDRGISDLKVTRQNVTAFDYAKRPHGVAGGGDLLTAILACWLTAGHDLNAAFAAASQDAHHIIDDSATAIDIALFDNLHKLTACGLADRAS